MRGFKLFMKKENIDSGIVITEGDFGIIKKWQ